MRKLFLLLLIYSVTILACAERINVNTAQQVAISVAAKLQSANNLKSNGTVSLVYAAPTKTSTITRSTTSGEIDYYIFNIGNEDGFVIIAGEDRVRPILGYSATGKVDMKKMPDNMKSWLDGYQNEISWIINKNISASKAIKNEWSRYLDGSFQMGNTMMLPRETALWSQGEPFNNMCPFIENKRALTGCGATAAAIIMKYYEFPTKPIKNGIEKVTLEITTDIDSYGNEIKENRTYDINWNGIYDWKNMPLSYVTYTQEQADAVAKLMWHIGAACELNYGESGTSANIEDVASALEDVFGYGKQLRVLNRADYKFIQWEEIIKSEINESRPVLYRGRTADDAGHLFVCDGYSDDLFHINWGWGWSSADVNGFFLLSALGTNADKMYNYNQKMIVNISPEQGTEEKSEPRIAKLIYENNQMPLPINETIRIRFDLKNIGNKAATYIIGLGIVDDNGKIIQLPQSQNSYSFKEGMDRYSYKDIYAEIELSQTLSNGQYIAFMYSIDNKNWEIVPVTSDTSLGIGNTGYIEQNEPINIELPENSFDNCYLYGTDSKQGLMSMVISGTKAISLCYEIKDAQKWFNSGIEFYYNFDKRITDNNKNQIGVSIKPDEESKIWIDIPADKVKENILSYYLYIKFNGKVNSIFEYDLSVYNKERTKCYQTFNANITIVDQSLIWFSDQSPLQGCVNTDIPFSLTATNVDPTMIGKTVKVSLAFLNISKEHISFYRIKDNKQIQVDLQSMVYQNSDGTQLPACRTEDMILSNLQEGGTYDFILKSNIISSNLQMRFYYAKIEEADLLYKDFSFPIKITTENPMAIEEIDRMQAKVYSKDGSIYVQTPKQEQVLIISISGAIVKNEKQIGLQRYDGLQRGVYVVKVGKQVFKIRN